MKIVDEIFRLCDKLGPSALMEIGADLMARAAKRTAKAVQEAEGSVTLRNWYEVTRPLAYWRGHEHKYLCFYEGAKVEERPWWLYENKSLIVR